MRRRYIVVVSLVIAVLLGATVYLLVERGPAIPRPPTAPSEVVSIWKSPSSSYALPPILVGNLTLQPFGNDGDLEDTPTFALDEGEWIDVITSSDRQLADFGIEKPWETSFRIVSINSTWDSSMLNSVFAPFYGKVLYENEGTLTQGHMIYSTAVRSFAWEGPGNYHLEFTNFNPHEEAPISYEVHKLGVTLGWGENYEKAKLQPWLNSLYDLLVRNKITQAENNAAEDQWLEQFK